LPNIKEIVVSALLEAAENVSTKEALANLGAGVDFDLAELGLESLHKMQIIMHIEEVLDIELDIDDVSEQETLGALVDFVTGKVGSN